MEMPTIGRIVHFVKSVGQVRPAIVTHVFSESMVNLTVFSDGSFDPSSEPASRCVTSVECDRDGIEADTWHWPERTVRGVSNV